MLTKKYIQKELALRIKGIRPNVTTNTDVLIGELKSALMMVDCLPDDEPEKKYNEAMLRADEAVQKGCLDKDMFDIIFPPEESEDERVRKWLIQYIKDTHPIANYWNGAPTISDVLSWLEKQKEQKPVQSAEEKEFVRTIKSIIADFILDKKPEDVGYYQQIYDWLDGRHIEQKPNIEICPHSIKSKSYSENPITPEMMGKAAEQCTWSQCDDNRFWIIDRAKKDILAKTNIESSPEEMKVLDSFLFRCWQMGWLSKYDVIVPEQKPAKDKYQQELESTDRWQEGYEAGYNAASRPAWSEEDDKMRNLVPEVTDEEIEEMVTKRSRSSGTTKSEMAFYRNGIKDAIKRFGLRPSWKPSEEQMNGLTHAINLDVYDAKRYGLDSLYNDLKKLM